MHSLVLLANTTTGGAGDEKGAIVVIFLLMSVFTTLAAAESYTEKKFNKIGWVMLAAWTALCAYALQQPVFSEAEQVGRGFYFLCYLPCLAALAGPIVRYFASFLNPLPAWALYLVCFSAGHFAAWYAATLYPPGGAGAAPPWGIWFVLCPAAGVAAFVAVASIASLAVRGRQQTKHPGV